MKQYYLILAWKHRDDLAQAPACAWLNRRALPGTGESQELEGTPLQSSPEFLQSSLL